MKKKVNLIISLLILLFIYCDIIVYAYDDKVTHRTITRVSIEKSNLRKSDKKF